VADCAGQPVDAAVPAVEGVVPDWKVPDAQAEQTLSAEVEAAVERYVPAAHVGETVDGQAVETVVAKVDTDVAAAKVPAAHGVHTRSVTPFAAAE
jgi:hypothetical protein